MAPQHLSRGVFEKRIPLPTYPSQDVVSGLLSTGFHLWLMEHMVKHIGCVRNAQSQWRRWRCRAASGSGHSSALIVTSPTHENRKSDPLARGRATAAEIGALG